MTVWIVNRRTRHGEDAHAFSSENRAWAAAAEMAIMDADYRRPDSEILDRMRVADEAGDHEDIVYAWREEVAREDHEWIEVRDAELDGVGSGSWRRGAR